MSPPAFSLSADAAPVLLAAGAVALLWPLYAYAKKRFIRALEMQLARRVAELTAANHKLALRAAQAEEAQETAKAALAAKDAALGRMGHGLRTPAGALLGFDDLLAATALTEEQKNYRSHIRNAAESLVSALDEAEQATVDATPQAAP
ncbi:MAG: hypothetical protein JO089_08480, partial [Alphaproteobacteria bacterium]|nr:hypothetical protein [Alphaproteobacteria bacterium]